MMYSLNAQKTAEKGFALVVTLSLMILLTVIAVGLLTLSTISLRSSAQGSAMAEARANARLALMVALGELQKEMGPDMRISTESALLDTNPNTEAIDGVGHARWLGSYNSWGNWLNARYTLPGTTTDVNIASTYTAGRENMFRRWLLSLPVGDETRINSPKSTIDPKDPEWVDMVGEGSLGQNPKAGDATRAYLTTVGKTGKYAWWIGPENHKAKITLTGQPRTTLTAARWQESQGDTGEVGIGALAGFGKLDKDTTGIGKKLISTNSLSLGLVESDDQVIEEAKKTTQKHFFDLTANSQGVIASVRTGHLKKDLSLLFEKRGEDLPAPYKFNPGSDIREPSIRPMSQELSAKNPVIPNRHFASWTNMRHYYRMYRSGSDAAIGEIGGSGSLKWNRSKPSTDFVSTTLTGTSNPGWDGSNHYWRTPILAKVTFIYSTLAEPSPTASGKFDCYQVYSPIFTFWNPYNTELAIPSGVISMLTSAYKIMPNAGQFWLGNTINKDTNSLGLSINTLANLGPAGGSYIFKPGELRVFSFAGRSTAGGTFDLVPGFDPQAIGGEKLKWGTYTSGENPGLSIEFSHSYWGGNVNLGNTGGAFAFSWWWNRSSSPGGLPLTFSNDWFQRSPHVPDQTHTPMTPPGLTNVARWIFDGRPNPVAFSQLAIKGLSNFGYESIDWEKDWRSRNWIQAPPYYFGSGLYMSMDDTIAHTQRLDCPYTMYFGPTSMSEMGNVVGHLGTSSSLGSGSSPYEKVTSAAMLELPSAPLSSLAGFANMRINPGWVAASSYLMRDPPGPNLQLKVGEFRGDGYKSKEASLFCAEVKRVTYQSGVTGPGIGNSFLHPMLPQNDVYRFIDNSKSQDTINRKNPSVTETIDTKAYCDYWDHTFLLNDTLWDDYFVSSLADQTRPGANPTLSLSANFDRLVANQGISNMRYRYHSGEQAPTQIKTDLQGADGYLKAAKHLVVDGMFNVNSTSVTAWQALFAGIRERQLVFRDSSGSVQKIPVPSGKRIALSRFDTEVSDKEMTNPGQGVVMPDGSKGWSGVRFLDDVQLLKLAEECVKQVKQRGPFLNFSEFINRRLSNDNLGLKGALQSAIDYDDAAPDSKSINFLFKQTPSFMITKSDLGVAATGDITKRFSTPEAAEGSRLAGIPGYVIQSDLLKPIANTLAVRDDTFRIRAYGETLANGKVIARAWCEAVVQRVPEYQDSFNSADVSARLLDPSGVFSDNLNLSTSNLRFGRKFRIESFRWLNTSEI